MNHISKNLINEGYKVLCDQDYKIFIGSLPKTVQAQVAIKTTPTAQQLLAYYYARYVNKIETIIKV